jgi:hypothetical protein
LGARLTATTEGVRPKNEVAWWRKGEEGRVREREG